jgi:hypothetical protein
MCTQRTKLALQLSDLPFRLTFYGSAQQRQSFSFWLQLKVSHRQCERVCFIFLHVGCLCALFTSDIHTNCSNRILTRYVNTGFSHVDWVFHMWTGCSHVDWVFTRGLCTGRKVVGHFVLPELAPHRHSLLGYAGACRAEASDGIGRYPTPLQAHAPAPRATSPVHMSCPFETCHAFASCPAPLPRATLQ